MKTLRDIGEDELIRRIVRLVPTGPGVGEAPGDDCSVVDSGGERLLLLKTDALVEGVHYDKSAYAEAVGWKAVARVFSDFAAMGGVGERFMVTLALPGSTELAWVEGLYAGMGKCLREFGAILAGGETCRVPEGSAAVVSISATGSVKRGKVVLRSGGKIGDEIWVTGKLGGSLSGKHLSFSPRVAEGLWLAEHAGVTAMMDLSDGLAKDLPRLAKASGCGFEIRRHAIPLNAGCSVEQALGDGEDFELMFSTRTPKGVEAAWKKIFPELELTRIGRLLAAGEGTEMPGGWDHFG